MNDILQKEIIKRINDYENPKRIALSRKYPFLEKPVIFLRCLKRSVQNNLDPRIQIHKKNDFFDFTIAAHQSELRKNTDSKDLDIRLQENKIYNIKKAAEKLNGIIIEPGRIFSFWYIVGNPSSRNGYIEGRVYSKGKIVTGIGGGLCQLSTFLYWLFLNAPVKVIERHPHSLDAFPSSKQNISLRCGAAVLYNFFDLKIRNDFEHPIQLKIWFTDDHINGQIMSKAKMPNDICVLEKDQYFIKVKDKKYLYNEIYREIKDNGQLIKTEKITVNFMKVLYNIDSAAENGFNTVDFDIV
ncbi:MAG: VanW family protein [Treponema sp.]|nr:VanW family protein [Treponema sp.]